MKKYLSAAIVFFVIPHLFAQSDTTAAPPSDPDALLGTTAPYYDYTSAEMKPWRARYHYQYYDGDGLPISEGEFDYWWSTSKVSRISWTHGDQSHIEWHTADGKELRSVTANDIAGLEHRLSSALLPGFVKMKETQSADRQLKYFTIKISSGELRCAGSVKSSTPAREIHSLGDAWPAYCFRENEPVLIASHENDTIATFYSQPREFQKHNFAGQIQIFYAGKKRVEAKLEDLSEVPADDAAFTPSADAKDYVPNVTKTTVPITQIRQPVPVERVAPVYPPGARATHTVGTVVVEATIGKSGKVKNASIVSSPDTSLSAAALDAVRQWRYEPVMVNGQPMEIHTQISLNFGK